jgi:hypothetical protein
LAGTAFAGTAFFYGLFFWGASFAFDPLPATTFPPLPALAGFLMTLEVLAISGAGFPTAAFFGGSFFVG